MSKKAETILLMASISFLLLSIYFGLHTRVYDEIEGERVTDLGRVVLSAVFGFGAVAGLAFYVRILIRGD
jgi:uncharacterized membrane protein YbhN (UPF0104 family)